MGLGNFIEKGGGSLIGGALSAGASIFGATKSANSADESVRRQIAWERERATHAHQWEIQDLKAAGLNPVLSAGGSGATTGGISAPVPDTSGYAEAGNKFFSALESQSQAALNKANTAKTGAEVANINADTSNKIEQNALIKAQTLVEQAKKGLINQQELKTKFEALIKEYDNKYKELSFWNGQIGTAAKTINLLGDVGFQLYDRIPVGRAFDLLKKGYKNIFPGKGQVVNLKDFTMPTVF